MHPSHPIHPLHPRGTNCTLPCPLPPAPPLPAQIRTQAMVTQAREGDDEGGAAAGAPPTSTGSGMGSMHACAACGRRDEASGPAAGRLLKACTQCKRAVYCSRACQVRGADRRASGVAEGRLASRYLPPSALLLRTGLGGKLIIMRWPGGVRLVLLPGPLPGRRCATGRSTRRCARRNSSRRLRQWHSPRQRDPAESLLCMHASMLDTHMCVHMDTESQHGRLGFAYVAASGRRVDGGRLERLCEMVALRRVVCRFLLVAAPRTKTTVGGGS